MFFVSFASLWSFSYFLYITYSMLVLSVIMYLVPAVKTNVSYSFSKKKIISDVVTGFDIFPVLALPFVTVLLLNLIWSSPEFSAWFGHIIFTSFQYKITYLVTLFFLVVSFIFLSVSYFSSREIYDYLITTFGFWYWILLLFFSNSIFTAIFIIEVLSALIFLLLTTSTFSTTFFYRNLNFSFGGFFQNSTPSTHLTSIIFFFWTSLLASLSLFIFLILFFMKISTFDYYLMEHIFLYLVQISHYRDMSALVIVWFVLMFSIFLKCGIAPLFLWKPTFFKGLPIYTIFFYITFFYFFIFLFFITLLSSYFGDILGLFSVVSMLFVLSGLLTLLFIMCEAYYLKSFMAISSILNSLLVLLALSASHTTDIALWL